MYLYMTHFPAILAQLHDSLPVAKCIKMCMAAMAALAASPPPHLRTIHWSPAVFMIKPHKPRICWRRQHIHTSCTPARLESKLAKKHQVARIPKAVLEKKYGFVQTSDNMWGLKTPLHPIARSFPFGTQCCSMFIRYINIQDTCPCPDSSQCRGAKFLNGCSHGWKKL